MSTRDLSHETPSLFDAHLPSFVETPEEEKGAANPAKDFVRWCCSFGSDFRNSPDVTNLRYWARKNKLKFKERDEGSILETARPLFLKRVELLVKKSEPQN